MSTVEDEDIPPAEQAIGSQQLSPQYVAAGYSPPTGQTAITPENPLPPAIVARMPTDYSAQYQAAATQAAPTLAPLPPPAGKPDVGVTNATYNPEATGQGAGSFALAQRPVTAPTDAGAGELARMGKAEAARFTEIAHDQEQADRAKSQAIDANAAVQRQQSREEYELQRQNQQQQNALDAAHAERQGFVQSHTDQALGQVEAAQQQAAAMTFDPDHFVHSLSGGEQALGALSIMLGGLGSALTGGPNQAVSVLQQKMNADVDAQKERYQRARSKIDDASNMYAKFRQQGMDESQAHTAAKMALASQLSTGLNVIGAKYADPAAEAKRQELLAGLQQMQVEHKKDFVKLTGDRAQQLYQDRQQNRQFEWNKQLQTSELGEKYAALEQKAQASQKAANPLGGWKGTAATPGLLDKAAAIASDSASALPLLDEMIDYRKRRGNGVLNRDDIAQVKSTATQLKLQLKNVYQLGVLSGSDEKLLDEIETDPTQFSAGDIAGRLKHFRDQLEAKTARQMHVYGFEKDKNDKGPAPYIDAQPVEGGK